METIPRIIHQTWKNEQVPEHFQVLAQSWKENHPDWEYKLWTDDMNRDFIKQHNMGFLDIYDSYPYNIQRVDAVRYFILYEFGGVFIDLDFESLANIEPLLRDQDCVFGIEPDEHRNRFKKEMIICNAFMACSPKNPFFKAICDDLKNIPAGTRSFLPSWLQILESTGPFKLTAVFNKFEDKASVKLLSADVIYPLTIKEAREILSCDTINESLQEKIDNAFAVHYFWGNWWE